MKQIALVIALVISAISAASASSSVPLNAFPGQLSNFLLCSGGVPEEPVETYVGANCVETGIRELDPQGRELWVRADIQIERSDLEIDQPYGILLSAMASSAFYWNGVLIDSNGVPGPNREAETPGKMDALVYVPSAVIHEGINTLGVHMSSFHNPATVTQPVHFIGVYRYQDQTLNRLQGYVPALITAGGLILAAFYFGLTFAFDRKRVGALLLALMSLATIGQLSAEVMRGLIAYDYPVHVMRLNFVVGFSFAFSMALVAFVVWRYNNAWFKGVVATTFGVCFLSIIAFPSYDMRTSVILLTGCLVAAAALIPVLKTKELAPRLILGALASFVVLIMVRQGDFLDQDFYFAVLILSGVLFGGEVVARRREVEARQEADTRTAKLELELLRRQISPHFLMNTLNVLSAWVEQDPKVSVNIIETLASECRALDELSRKQLVPLSEELTLCETHLKLMSYRTEAEFSLNTSGDVVGKMVPPATILTLIENAFSHNHYPDGAVFHLALKSVGSRTELEFAAPIGPAKESGSPHEGMGISYVRARLSDAFGANWSLDQGPDEANHWRVAMSYD